MTYNELRKLAIDGSEITCTVAADGKSTRLHGVLKFNKETYGIHENIDILTDIEIRGLYQHINWHDEHKFSLMIAKINSIRPQITDIKSFIKELIW